MITVLCGLVLSGPVALIYKVVKTPSIGNFCYIETTHHTSAYECNTHLLQNIDWGYDREVYCGDVDGAFKTAERMKCEIK